MYPIFTKKTIESTPFLFFTGKGGVGKTSIACATAVSLADEGKRVLIVSTDPASNLQDVFNVEISSNIVEIPAVSGLSAVNLDPEEAAAAYRDKVVGPFRDKLPAPVVAQMEEQLSGACTVEIAAFDEFAQLLTKEEIIANYDHIVFDTAPTGHTLRLLQLPTAWSGFLEESTHGASCLGPLSGLEEKKGLYEATVQALSNSAKTSLILVTRPDNSAIKEAERASLELREVGLTNQLLVVNGVFEPANNEDKIAMAFYQRQQEASTALSSVNELSIYELPYIPFPLTGVESLRRFFAVQRGLESQEFSESENLPLPGLEAVIDQLAQKKSGVIMTMGKGGVGKTTIAAAITVGLSLKGKKVHLTTTDPAAHLSHVLKEETIAENVSISRIDPEKEVAAYRDNVLKTAGENLDEDGLAYLKEDLESPCTEEIAVFQAFANVVDRAEDEFVVIDTAPTGHTLLLLEASQSYYREIERSTGEVPESVKKLIPRLKNKEETDVIVVTLPEATPVLEASRLQEDLKRADMSPSWWVINQSLAATNTKDPVLQARQASEGKWIQRVVEQEGKQVALIPWAIDELIGVTSLQKIFK